MECYFKMTDYGPTPHVMNVEKAAMQNENFRTAVWTGCHAQMTLMCILPCEDIGVEMHKDTDQIIRVEQGQAMVKMGKSECMPDMQYNIGEGEVVFVPAGTWHNIINMGKCTLKLSSIYTPPNHPRGVVHRTKADSRHY